MKRIATAIWTLLQTIGQYRYEQAKRRGYGMY